MAERLVKDTLAALDEQTVVVPGTQAADLIIPSLATSLASVLDQRKLLANRIEEMLEAHPLSQVLTSMPGIGVRTAARILIDIGSAFPTAGHLAAYAGLAPVDEANRCTFLFGRWRRRAGDLDEPVDVVSRVRTGLDLLQGPGEHAVQGITAEAGVDGP